MKTTAKKEAKTKDSKSSAKNKNLDAKNKQQIEYRITHEKELKYIYPEEAGVGATKKEVLGKRKKYRAMVRRNMQKLEKELKAAKKTKDEAIIRKAERAMSKFEKAHFAE